MKNSRVLPPVVVLALTFLAFLPSLNFGFLAWDDVKNVVTNPYLRHVDGTSLAWMWTTHFQGPYQPLSWLSLALDFWFWGLRPLGYHATNLVFHMMNAVLVYFLLRRLFKSTESRWAAAAGALFFAIHPLRTESVAWVTERRDVLSGFFFLLSVMAYERREMKLAWVTFAAALCSKATTVGLVWVLVALDLTFLQRLPLDPRRWREAEYRHVWKEKIPFLAMAFMAGIANLAMFHAQGILQSRYGVGDRIALFLANASFYLQKMVWPHPLLPYYELPVQLSAIRGLLVQEGLMTLILTAIAWRLRKSRPAFTVLWITYLLLLVPISGVAQNGQQIAADRYTYLVLLPWAAGLTGLLIWRPWLGRLVFPVLGIFLFMTRHQVWLWRSDESLWLHTVRYAPESYLARSNLGTLYLRQGREVEAAAQLREAVRLRPTDVEGRLNLGYIEERQSRFSEAEALYREALAVQPGNVQVQNNLALVHAREGHFQDAIQALRSLVAANPSFAEARLNLGVLLLHEGFPAEGQTFIRQALVLKPELAARLGPRQTARTGRPQGPPLQIQTP